MERELLESPCSKESNMEKEDLNLIEGNANQELKIILGQRFQDLFWQVLTYLEIAFPHKPGDGSDNERSYNSLRSKVLRIGNDAIRSSDDLFKSFVAFKVYEYKQVKRDGIKTEIYNFKNKFKVNGVGEEIQNGEVRKDS